MKSIIPASVLFAFVICFFIVACKKNVFDSNGWQPQILGPVATGTVTVEAISDIKNKSFQQIINASDLGFTQESVPFIPALSIKQIGPYTNQVSDYFQYGEVDTANLDISFVNNFPFTVKAGTKIVLRSSMDTSNANDIVVSHSIISDIPTGTTYTFPLVFTSKYVPSIIYLYLNNFQTDAVNNAVFSDAVSKVTFNLNILRINLIALNANKSYSLNDTSSFQISGSQSSSVSDSALAGTFKLYLNNRMPVNFSTQLIFLDGNKKAIDSLIKGNTTVVGATTNSNGLALNPVSNLIQVPVNYAMMNNLKQAQYIVYRVSANTFNMPGSVVVAGKGSGADFQLISDLKVQIGSFVN